jgi:hypothetical protein
MIHLQLVEVVARAYSNLVTARSNPFPHRRMKIIFEIARFDTTPKCLRNRPIDMGPVHFGLLGPLDKQELTSGKPGLRPGRVALPCPTDITGKFCGGGTQSRLRGGHERN